MKRILYAILIAAFSCLITDAARAQIVRQPGQQGIAGLCPSHHHGCPEPRMVGVPETILAPRFAIDYGCTCQYVCLPHPTCDYLASWQTWIKNLWCCSCNQCDPCGAGHQNVACSARPCGHVRKVNVLMKRKVVCGHEPVLHCNVVEAPPQPCRPGCTWNPLRWFYRPHCDAGCDYAAAPVTTPVSISGGTLPAPEPLPAPRLGAAGLAPMPSSATVIPATPVPVHTIPVPTPAPPMNENP